MTDMIMTGQLMYWDDSQNDEAQKLVTGDVIDLVFRIKCTSLPADHAYSLSKQLQNLFPWFASENAGMHIVHIPESAHGWTRETGPDAIMLPSRRTKLILRLPRHRVDEVKTLSGKSLDVDGHELALLDATEKLLSEITTIISRHVVTGGKDESDFTSEVMDELSSMGIKPKKLLCGVEKKIRIEGEIVATRSVMLADISVEESVSLQQKGLGPHREYGCGIFIPQKDIHELS